jgi:hypothetical protein
MTQYANFDHTVPDPKPVIAWYDTEAWDYPSLPAPEDLLEMTPDQWQARLSGSWAINNGALVPSAPLPQPQPPTGDGTYASLLAQGITITSDSTPALNATYPITDADFARVGGIARDAASGIGLPNGAATVPIPDIDGGTHDFSATSVVDLYKAERDLRMRMAEQRDIMIAGGTPQWPYQVATIP